MYAIVILDVCSHLSPAAFAVYSRSPAAFEALSSFKILQLHVPSSTTLKSYVQSNKEAPAECANRLAHERSLYNAQVKEHVEAEE